VAARRRRPFALSPAVLIRSNALRKGVFGSSNLWRAVAVVVFGSSFLRRLLGRRPEIIGTEVLRPGQFVRIEALAPAAGRPRRRARRTAP
jgi:hypothetical protein